MTAYVLMAASVLVGAGVAGCASGPASSSTTPPASASSAASPAGAPAQTGRAVSPSGSVIDLPADHAPHNESLIEWWYYSGIFFGDHDSEYAVLFTIFRAAPTNQALVNVIDLRSGELVGHSEMTGRQVDPQQLDLSAGGTRLRLDGQRFVLTLRDDELRLHIDAQSLKPFAAHGEDGIIDQGPAGPSNYYSATWMQASGRMVADRQGQDINGTFWMDHQWGDFGADARAYDFDWFSLRFDDGSQMMLYRFLGPDGAPLTQYDTGTYVAPDGTASPVGSFTLTPLGRPFVASAADQPSPLAGADQTYPQAWRIEVAQPRLDLIVRPIVRDQFIRNTDVRSFLEEACTITGDKSGHAFVEISRP